jgi:ataxin-10
MIWTERLESLKERQADDRNRSDEVVQFAELYQQLCCYHHQTSNASEDILKELVAETRSALRYATNCLAAPVSRQMLQQQAVLQHQVHEPLSRIVSSRHAASDARCRLLSARLLSNLVSGCDSATASRVMTDVNPSPSGDQVAAALVRQALPSSSRPSYDDGSRGLNWLDMVLGCTGNRDAMAATVAALYNCLVVLSIDSSDHAASIASNQLLTSNILRQMLPSNSVAVDSAENLADAATEWISLLLGLLCQQGLFQQLYQATHSSTVVPEHLVLLHNVSATVHEWPEASPIDQRHPLGSTENTLVATHVFCAKQAERIKQESTDDEDLLLLQRSARMLLLEILATSLGNDSLSLLARVRRELGPETITQVVFQLSRIVDSLLELNEGKSARELTLSEEDQRWITLLVRLLGNLCFRCRPNQDQLRSIQVPQSTDSTTRNGLHVLLSCTSLASGCFTLREWALVAIRNALEDNVENQAVVQALEAQQPLQSAPLDRMGLRVDMDRRGQVKVVPKDDEPLH